VKVNNAMDAARDRNMEAIIDDAAQWVVRMGAPDVSVEDKRTFIAWLKRSPVHLGEYLRLERTWADLGSLDAAHRIDVEALLASEDANVVEVDFGIAKQTPAPDRASPLARGIPAALAACLVLAMAGVLWFEIQFPNRYATGVGEQRTVKLTDGSTVVLNTNTKLRVDLSDERRIVRLLQGEALFNVAKDAARPFRVLSDRAIAQAVGTSFIVRRQEQQTVVTVIEGQVAVAHSGQIDEFKSAQIPAHAVRVAAGVRADVADRAIKTALVENPANVTAWRSGRLIFEGATLAEVVAEFNRYNEVQIVLQDSRLSNERLSGVFDADQPQALARFLEHSGVVEPLQMAGDSIILVPQR
jgi:transmembrane sensor